jgi:hypothetical protein
MGDKINDSYIEDELFNKDELNKTLNKAKKRSMVRNAIITVTVVVTLLLIVLVGGKLYIEYKGNKIYADIENYYEITNPNTELGVFGREDGLLSGKVIYVPYKLIGDKVVTLGPQEVTYGLFTSSSSNNFVSIVKKASGKEDVNKMYSYDPLGNRLMNFYHPKGENTFMRNDLEKLEDIGKDKLIEMAVCFDKEYTVAEVQAMIPEDIDIGWYWVNDVYTKEQASRIIEVYGIQEENGTRSLNLEEKFVSNLESAIKQQKSKNNMYKQLYNRLKKDKSTISKDDIKIIGVVVTGDAQSLKKLRSKDFIKASSLGVVTDKY